MYLPLVFGIFFLNLAAQAQVYLGYEQVTFTVGEAPGAPRIMVFPTESRYEVRQPMRTSYGLNSENGRSMEVSARTFQILAVLFKTRGGFHSPEELNRILASEFEYPVVVSDWSREVESLNRQILEGLGKPLILSEGGGDDPAGVRFKLASNQIATDSDQSLFALTESRTNISYRGRNIKLTPKQGMLIYALTISPGRRLAEADARGLLGLSPTSKRIPDIVEEINQKSLWTTGATLIVMDGGAVFLQPLAPTPLHIGLKSYLVRGKSLLLGPYQQLVFEGLGLERRTLSSQIILNARQFAGLGVNPYELRTALRGINRKFVESFGAPAVALLQIEGMNNSTLVWTKDDLKRFWSPAFAWKQCQDALQVSSDPADASQLL